MKRIDALRWDSVMTRHLEKEDRIKISELQWIAMESRYLLYPGWRPFLIVEEKENG